MGEHFRLACQRVQSVGVEHHRLGDLLIQPQDELIEVEGAAQAGTAGDGRGLSASLAIGRRRPAAIRPAASAGKGTVM